MLSLFLCSTVPLGLVWPNDNPISEGEGTEEDEKERERGEGEVVYGNVNVSHVQSSTSTFKVKNISKCPPYDMDVQKDYHSGAR